MTEQTPNVQDEEATEAPTGSDGAVEQNTEDTTAEDTDDSTVEDSTEEVPATEEEILGVQEGDDEQTALDIPMGTLKTAIRNGSFSKDELDAIVDEGMIDRRVVEILLAHPLEQKGTSGEADDSGTEEASPKKPKSDKASVAGKVTAKIVQLLLNSPTGLTIEEICVQLHVLTDDGDPTDPETKTLKKRYRTFARKAVDGHPDGSREHNLGRNRLYSIGDVTTRELEETVEEEESTKA